MRSIHTVLAGLLSAVMTAAVLVPCVPASAQEEILVPSGIAASALSEKIEEFAEDKNYASFETSVFCGDEVLYTGYFGYADRENSIPADAETVYEWGSISKLLVWVSVMQLHERGILDLERDVREYLPPDFLRKLRYDTPITMLDLMNHRAGFQETMYEIQTPDADAVMPLDKALRYTEPAQVFAPDTVTSYSNWSAALAGYIVETVSGEMFSDYVHNHIFDPLGMEHTSIAPDCSDNPWVAAQRECLHSYLILDVGGRKIEQALDTNRMYVHLYPAGSATGTLEDLTRFAQALAVEDSPLFADPATHRELLTATSTYGEAGTPRNCHGIWVSSGQDVLVYGHGGNTVACTSALQFDPVSGTGVVVMTNQYSESVICSGIQELVFGKAVPDEEMPALPDPGSIAGVYVGARSDFKGMTKFVAMTGLLPVTEQSDGVYSSLGIAAFRSLGGGMYCITQAGASMLCYATDSPRKVLQMPYMDYVESGSMAVCFVLMLAYIALAVTAGIWLLVVGIRRLMKKGRAYSGKRFLLIGQGCRCVSFLGVIVLLLVYALTQAGLTHAITAVLGIVQILCLLGMLAAGAVSVLHLVKRPEHSARIPRYVLGLLGNGIAAAAVLCLDLCVFWI